MLYNEGGVYMPRVYFGYIQDVYPAYRCNAKIGSGQGPNIFIEFLKKNLTGPSTMEDMILKKSILT